MADSQDFSATTPGEVPYATAGPAITCWRCGKQRDANVPACSWCEAPLNSDDVLRRTPSIARSLVRLMGAFALLLVVNLVLIFVRDSWYAGMTDVLFVATPLGIIGTLVATLTVLVTLWIVPRPAPLPTVSWHMRLATWGLSLPLLAAMLLINAGYHTFLQQLVIPETLRELLLQHTPHTAGVAWGIVIFSICIQPAIFEELLFRYLALGTLSTFMSVHAALAVSAIMFGTAHLGMPYGVPYLIAFGWVLGWIRWNARSLLLPIFLHALHNGVVLYVENGAPWTA